MSPPPAATEFIFSLLRTSAGLEYVVDFIGKHLELTANEWRTLRAFGATSEGLTVPHAARKIGLTRQGVQRLAGSLAERGFIRFEDNEFHAKSRRAVLTSEGREAFRQGIAIELEVTHRLMGDFGDDEIRVATNVLEKLRKRFKIDHAVVPPSRE